MKLKSDTLDLSKYLNPPKGAEHFREAGVWIQEVKDWLCLGKKIPGADLPWTSKTQGRIALRPGEVSIWAGFNGHWKSLMLGQIALSLIFQRECVLIASLEMKPPLTLERMACQAIGSYKPTPSAIDRFGDWFKGLLWIYDQQGIVDHKRLLALLRYAAEELKIQHVVIDSLMKCGIRVDDWNTQKEFVDALCAYGKDTDVHVHLVAHSRKQGSEMKRVDKLDVRGAGEITDQADNVFIIWRNKPKEEGAAKGDDKHEKEPDCLLSVAKQRHGRWEGTIGLWLHRDSGQFVSKEGAPPIDYLGFDRPPPPTEGDYGFEEVLQADPARLEPRAGA